MMIEAPTKIQVSGIPKNIGNSSNEIIYVLKYHIELLESNKMGIEEIIINHEMTTPFVNGIIKGINLTIEQLYEHINQLKEN